MEKVFFSGTFGVWSFVAKVFGVYLVFSFGVGFVGVFFYFFSF